jgi:hypothetical protein
VNAIFAFLLESVDLRALPRTRDVTSSRQNIPRHVDGNDGWGLWDAAKKIFDEDFADQVLSFDSDAADMYAEIASRRTAGKPISQFDAMIVSMARSRGAGLATRNVKDFEDYGVDVVNPWSA